MPRAVNVKRSARLILGKVYQRAMYLQHRPGYRSCIWHALCGLSWSVVLLWPVMLCGVVVRWCVERYTLQYSLQLYSTA